MTSEPPNGLRALQSDLDSSGAMAIVQPIVYTRRDLKSLFQCSDRTISRIVNRDAFPQPLIAGRWLKSDVDRWLSDKSNRHTTPESANVRHP